MRIVFCLLLLYSLAGCSNPASNYQVDAGENLKKLFEQYDEERLRLYPFEATVRGDERFNDVLPIEFTEGYRDSLRSFYSGWLSRIREIDTTLFQGNDLLSIRVFRYEMEMNLEGLRYPFHLIPFQQFSGLPLDLGQLGSGEGSQPFHTRSDFENWNRRAARFSAWADSAIVYFNKGIRQGIVLPRAVVLKMIPQMRELGNDDAARNVFFGPLNRLKGKKDSALIGEETMAVLKQKLLPAYRKLAEYLEKEYLPAARSTSGLGALPGGEKLYDYYVRYWTTTGASADEIYEKGLSEVSRIRKEMERVKDSMGFAGNLNAFFRHLRTDPKLMPYSSPEEVLNAFRSIQNQIEPHLDRMFSKRPASPFAIKQTEDFRAASASAEYQVGTPDGSRPGIFYVPILDAKSFNITSGMESLFLHEAIPGHHFQISLQQENRLLPAFRRFAWYGAFGEGWALYCESLGKELGLYSDPYQYLGALGDEIHRAIRLVVDVGIHKKGMNREEAIRYMMENEAIDHKGAESEIERYMVWPGQALSYKWGALRIAALRQKCSERLGSGFSLAEFHDEILKDGVLPLNILEDKMERWVKNKGKEKSNKL